MIRTVLVRALCAIGTLATVFTLGLAQDAEIPKLKPVAAGERLNLVVFAGTRPVRIRLNLSLDDRSVTDAWRAHLKRWFDFLDRDGDGSLSEDELMRAPSPTALLQGMRQGNVVLFTGLGIPGGNFENRTAKLASFMDYYRANGAGPVSVQRGVSPIDNVSGTLFKLLDRDKDGMISRAELAAAPQSLSRLDSDDDELISMNELIGNPNGFNGGFRPVMPGNTMQSPDHLLMILDNPASIDALLKRLDRDTDGALSFEEAGLSRAFFDRLDANGDGKIDRDELTGWINLPVDVEWSGSWAAPGAGMMAKDTPVEREHPALNAGDMSLQFSAAPRQAFNAGVSPAQYLMQIFKLADTKNQGFVSRDELKLPQHQVLKQVFGLLDRDNDGKLTEKEVQELLDLQREGLSCHVTLTFADQGRGLFTVIDANRDGFLSMRELRTAWKRLAPAGKENDDGVRLEQIPRQCALSASLGPNFGAAFGGGFRPAPNGQAVAARYPANTPAWFVKMDTNGDGEVSRREFLGPVADFRRLDADDDGVISPEEAIHPRKK